MDKPHGDWRVPCPYASRFTGCSRPDLALCDVFHLWNYAGGSLRPPVVTERSKRSTPENRPHSR